MIITKWNWRQIYITDPWNLHRRSPTTYNTPIGMLASNYPTNAKLTAGAVRAMYEGRPVDAPYLQFLQIKVYEKPNGGGVHYKYPQLCIYDFIGLSFPTDNTLFKEH